MATRKNKYAGRCEVCRKYIPWDDLQVVHDLTVEALRPAFDEAMATHPEGCDCNKSPIDDMVAELLSVDPVCPSCWHATNQKHSLTEGALRIVRAGVLIPPEAQFYWVRMTP